MMPFPYFSSSKVLRKTLVSPVFLAGFLLSQTAAQAEDSSVPATGSDTFNEAVHKYILENPQVIIEAIEVYQLQQRAAERRQQEVAFQQFKEDLENNKSSPIIGNPDGDIVLVEFFDYRCPYCRRAAAVIQELLDKDRNLKIVMKEFPILSPESVIGARAALAADQQGAYKEYHFELMHNASDLSVNRLLSLADKLNLDVEKFESDMESPEVTQQILETRQLATALGINGTPAFVLNGKSVPPGTLAPEFRKMIAEIRAQREG